MTISDTAIGNMALSAIGARSTIESIDENSPEAKQIKLWYEPSRQQALKVYNWSFARKRLTLAVSSESPPDEWGFRYLYPSDCLVIRKLVNPFGRQQNAIPYTIETVDATTGSHTTTIKTILTDLSSAVAMYTKDVTDYNFFTPYFTELLAHLIAHHIAFPLTGDSKVKGAMIQIYQSLVAGAPISDANEEVQDDTRDADWIRARAYCNYVDDGTVY